MKLLHMNVWKNVSIWLRGQLKISILRVTVKALPVLHTLKFIVTYGSGTWRRSAASARLARAEFHGKRSQSDLQVITWCTELVRMHQYRWAQKLVFKPVKLFQKNEKKEVRFRHWHMRWTSSNDNEVQLQVNKGSQAHVSWQEPAGISGV